MKEKLLKLWHGESFEERVKREHKEYGEWIKGKVN